MRSMRGRSSTGRGGNMNGRPNQTKQFVSGGTATNFTGVASTNTPVKNLEMKPLPSILKNKQQPQPQPQPQAEPKPEIPIQPQPQIQAKPQPLLQTLQQQPKIVQPVANMQEKKDVKPIIDQGPQNEIKEDEAPENATMDVGNNSSNDDNSSETPRKRWPFSGVRKKASLRAKERRQRQERRLRKTLIPKNAVMALNEIKGNTISDFKLLTNKTGFIAEMFVNNIRYEGQGVSKMAAKNDASEKALRDLVIAKMLYKPATSAAPEKEPEVDGEGDSPMVAVDEEEAELPILNLASYALHKLFTEWEHEGFDIPDFKGQGQALVDSMKKPVTVRLDLPPHHESYHPAMLLSLMRPGIQYTDLGSDGQTPNITHTVGVTVDDQLFIGAGRNKKLARKEAARQACNKLFNTTFIRDEGSVEIAAVPSPIVTA